MPIPTTEELRQEFQTDPDRKGYRDGNDFRPTREIMGLLGEIVLVTNPDPPKQIPVPLTDAVLLSQFTQPQILATPTEAIVRIGQLIDANDRNSLRTWITIALRKGWIDASTATNVDRFLQSTIDDPNHPAEIPDPGGSVLQKRWQISSLPPALVNDALGRT